MAIHSADYGDEHRDVSAGATEKPLAARVEGDAYNRLEVQVDGKISIGSGAAAPDVNLYRSAANTLKTDDSFEAVGSVKGTTGVITAHEAAATPTGGVSGEIRVGAGKIWVNDGGVWKSVAVA